MTSYVNTFASPNLLNAQTTDANGATLTLNGRRHYSNGINTVHVYGTFNGVTVTLQSSLDGTTWINIPGATFTSATVQNFSINTFFLRAVTSGSGGSTSVSCHVM